MSTAPKLAILMLCCRDYEAVELALACHMAYGDPEIPFFALQNCTGDYASSRTLAALRRYEALYPQTIRVLEARPSAKAYYSITAALRSEALADYDLICKVDDDAFPLAKGWIQELLRAWTDATARYGERLAYVTPLINNNFWGFPQVLKAMGLEQEYFERVARPHRVGANWGRYPTRILPADTIETGGAGTIWAAPDIARWLHERSTLDPDRYIDATRGLAPAAVPNDERYSIGCILFRKEFWDEIDDGGSDDEEMMLNYCSRRNLEIVCARSVPFVHLSYFTQKDELRDVVRKARDLYTQRLQLRHPIASKSSHLDEVETRLWYVEQMVERMAAPAQPAGGLPQNDVRIVEGSREVRNHRIPRLDLAGEELAARSSNDLVVAHMGQAARVPKPMDTLRHGLSLAPRGGLALEFGVATGGTLRVIADARADGRVWGFDSFEGLPEDWRPGFPAGSFAMRQIPQVPGAEIVTGLFDKTVPQFLVDHTDPVDFVHMDADLYSSSRTVLERIASRLRPGSVLVFDEYFNYPGWQDHEHKAWMEFVARTGVKFVYECFTLGDEQVAVRILK